MVAQAGEQLDLVRQLDQIVIGAVAECLGLGFRLLLGGEHDDWNITGGVVGAIELDQHQSIDIRHDQILQNDCGLNLGCQAQGVGSFDAAVQFKIIDTGKHAPERLVDDLLVIHEKDSVGRQNACLAGRLEISHCLAPPSTDRRQQFGCGRFPWPGRGRHRRPESGHRGDLPCLAP